MKQKGKGIQGNFIDVRNLSYLPTVTTLVCKDKDGNILSEKTANIGKMATIL